MTSVYLLPENLAHRDGTGADIALDAVRGKPLLLTLGITRIIEQESLEISIWGSADGKTWDLFQMFPQKFYCGTYPLVLDLTPHPHIRYLRGQWKMNRWGPRDTTPLFGFYLTAEESVMQAVGAAH